MDEDDQGGLRRRRHRIGDEHTPVALEEIRAVRTAERTRNSREAAKSEIGRRRRTDGQTRQLKKRQDLDSEGGRE